MFEKENQVSIPRFTSLARGDRSADQCLLSAAGSSTTGPNSCQTAFPLAGLAWPVSSPESHSSSRRWHCCSHLHSPRRAPWAPPKPTAREPQVSLGQPHTTSTGGQDLPDTRTAVGCDSEHPSPWPECLSSTQESKHASLLSDTSAPPPISTLYYSMAHQKRTTEILTVEKAKIILESCMNKIFCFFLHMNTKPELTVPLEKENSAPKKKHWLK